MPRRTRSQRRRLALTLAGASAAGAAAGLVAARRLDASWASHADPIRPEEWTLPEGQSFAADTPDGASLAVTVAGEGPLVVLAHGWTSRRQMWAPVAHRLVAAGRTVALYDERGHGESTCGRDGTTAEAIGDDLAVVLQALDARHAVVAGHSMGGMAILSCAARHPDVLGERAGALVLVSTASSKLGSGRFEKQTVAFMASPLVDRALAGPWGHAWVRRSIGRDAVLEHLRHVRDDTAACSPQTRSGFLAAMLPLDLSDVLPSITLPTTVMVGSSDHLTPPARAQALADGIPGATLITLPGRGHMLPLEAPDEVTAQLLGAGSEADSAQVAGAGSGSDAGRGPGRGLARVARVAEPRRRSRGVAAGSWPLRPVPGPVVAAEADQSRRTVHGAPPA